MTSLSTSELLIYYRQMLLIRRFEEKLSLLFTSGKLGGTSHFCIGQEACAVGVISATNKDDYIVSNHRGHGHLLARKLSVKKVMAELMGKSNGYCAGRGGSQHLCSIAEGVLGTNGITGGGIPIATGAALAMQQKRSSQIIICFFGDGATNQGTFHESLNMASLWKLPILFVCENNGYAMSQPVIESTASETMQSRANAYQIKYSHCDGMDLQEIRNQAAEFVNYIRNGNGPAFLELKTYRHCGHSKNDARVYRTKKEEREWLANDCLEKSKQQLLGLGVTLDKLQELEDSIEQELNNAVKFADSATPTSLEEVMDGIYAN